MSATSRGWNVAKHLRRQHKLQRDQVDTLPWPHPRPAADERIVCLNLAFIWTSTVQIILGPPPTSVQGISFGYTATVAFSVLMIVASVLVIYGAYCRSQYVSFGVEMAGTVGFTGVFLIYSAGAIFGLNDWFATNIAAFAIGQFIGNGIRATKLIRRLW